MKEHEFGKGVVRRNSLVKKLQKFSRRLKGHKIGKAVTPFDWATGFDVRNTIGSIQIKNQGQSFSCGGQVGAYFLEIQQRLRNQNEGAISAKSIYAPISYPGGGTTVTSLYTQIGAHGGNLELTVPSYDAYGAPLPEYMMTDKSWHTITMDLDATKRAGYTPYDIAEDIETVAQTVQAHGAVFIEISGSNNGTWLSPTPLTIKFGDYWYHYMLVIGARQFGSEKKLIVLNSWGEKCGDNGVQYFGEEWFKTGRIIDAFTLIHDSQIIPIPSAKPTIWQALAMWFTSQWKLAQSLT